MTRYHINPHTGNPGACKARISCPYGNLETEHFNSKEDARTAYESGKLDSAFNTLQRTVDKSLDDSQDLDFENEFNGKTTTYGSDAIDETPEGVDYSWTDESQQEAAEWMESSSWAANTRDSSKPQYYFDLEEKGLLKNVGEFTDEDRFIVRDHSVPSAVEEGLSLKGYSTIRLTNQLNPLTGISDKQQRKNEAIIAELSTRIKSSSFIPDDATPPF